MESSSSDSLSVLDVDRGIALGLSVSPERPSEGVPPSDTDSDDVPLRRGRHNRPRLFTDTPPSSPLPQTPAKHASVWPGLPVTPDTYLQQVTDHHTDIRGVVHCDTPRRTKHGDPLPNYLRHLRYKGGSQAAVDRVCGDWTLVDEDYCYELYHTTKCPDLTDPIYTLFTNLRFTACVRLVTTVADVPAPDGQLVMHIDTPVRISRATRDQAVQTLGPRQFDELMLDGKTRYPSYDSHYVRKTRFVRATDRQIYCEYMQANRHPVNVTMPACATLSDEPWECCDTCTAAIDRFRNDCTHRIFRDPRARLVRDSCIQRGYEAHEFFTMRKFKQSPLAVDPDHDPFLSAYYVTSINEDAGSESSVLRALRQHSTFMRRVSVVDYEFDYARGAPDSLPGGEMGLYPSPSDYHWVQYLRVGGDSSGEPPSPVSAHSFDTASEHSSVSSGPLGPESDISSPVHSDDDGLFGFFPTPPSSARTRTNDSASPPLTPVHSPLSPFDDVVDAQDQPPLHLVAEGELDAREHNVHPDVAAMVEAELDKENNVGLCCILWCVCFENCMSLRSLFAYVLVVLK